jgi:bifunctional ADP-heptose synthase (sugar kinase/adenylyltransferase)
MKILLIGDSCIDQYIYGTCDRISPEAPVPILRYSRSITKEGMAANVKNNLLAFGHSVDFITNTQQITKTRFIDEKTNSHILRMDDEVEIEPLTTLPDNINQYDVVVISDYNKGFLVDEYLIKLREMFSGTIFVDTKKRNLDIFDGCYVKINNAEYEAAKTYTDDIIITMGRVGAKYKDKVYPSVPVSVYDVCGAGDTFLAALAHSYITTNDIDISINYANKAASIAIQHMGVYVLTQEDIKTLC